MAKLTYDTNRVRVFRSCSSVFGDGYGVFSFEAISEKGLEDRSVIYEEHDRIRPLFRNEDQKVVERWAASAYGGSR